MTCKISISTESEESVFSALNIFLLTEVQPKNALVNPPAPTKIEIVYSFNMPTYVQKCNENAISLNKSECNSNKIIHNYYNVNLRASFTAEQIYALVLISTGIMANMCISLSFHSLSD
jgi:hypothetical protein